MPLFPELRCKRNPPSSRGAALAGRPNAPLAAAAVSCAVYGNTSSRWDGDAEKRGIVGGSSTRRRWSRPSASRQRHELSGSPTRYPMRAFHGRRRPRMARVPASTRRRRRAAAWKARPATSSRRVGGCSSCRATHARRPREPMHTPLQRGTRQRKRVLLLSDRTQRSWPIGGGVTSRWWRRTHLHCHRRAPFDGTRTSGGAEAVASRGRPRQLRHGAGRPHHSLPGGCYVSICGALGRLGAAQPQWEKGGRKALVERRAGPPKPRHRARTMARGGQIRCTSLRRRWRSPQREAVRDTTLLWPSSKAKRAGARQAS
eukprot:scaffold52186_cov29-Tisochrysis_lutea.AAC.2